MRSHRRARASLEDRYREIIARLSPGRSFIDVGCLWRVHGEYAFHAAREGAARVVGFDVNPPTPEFQARNAGDRVEFIRGDLNDVAFPDVVGPFDIVFCVSVLHHMPNPVATLLQLRRITRGHAIIGAPTIPERDLPHSAVYLPLLDTAARQKVLSALSTNVYKTGHEAVFDGSRTYVNWFWCFTASCLRAMLGSAGFEIVESHEYARFGCYVCSPAARGLPLQGAGDPSFRATGRGSV